MKLMEIVNLFPLEHFRILKVFCQTLNMLATSSTMDLEDIWTIFASLVCIPEEGLTFNALAEAHKSQQMLKLLTSNPSFIGDSKSQQATPVVKPKDKSLRASSDEVQHRRALTESGTEINGVIVGGEHFVFDCGAERECIDKELQIKVCVRIANLF